MSKLKVYIAGPMRGLPDWNYSAFEKAAKEWTEAGYHVFSPASIGVAMGYGLRDSLHCEGEPSTTLRAQPTTEEGKSHLQHVIMSDIACIFASDLIALLSGWEKSRGATVELALAQFFDLPVYCAEARERIYPPLIPWACLVHGIYSASSSSSSSPNPLQSREVDDWSDVWRSLPISRLPRKDDTCR